METRLSINEGEGGGVSRVQKRDGLPLTQAIIEIIFDFNWAGFEAFATAVALSFIDVSRFLRDFDVEVSDRPLDGFHFRKGHDVDGWMTQDGLDFRAD